MTDTTESKILTIPNLLTLLRLCMIPFFARAYMRGQYYAAVGILLLSAFTDIIDGRIARKYHAVSNLGKVLDPIADKLTQIVAFFALIRHFPHMLYILLFLIFKELVTGITGLLVLRRTKEVHSAVWHGKLTTVLLYTVMVLHLLFPEIPQSYSDLCIGLCLGTMLISFIMYLIRYIGFLKEAKARNSAPSKE